MIPKSGYRFPACAKPLARSVVWLMLRRAKAGRKRSCATNKLERDDDSKKSHPALKTEMQLGRDMSERVEEVNEILLLLIREADAKALVVEIHRVHQGRSRAVVEIGRARGNPRRIGPLTLPMSAHWPVIMRGRYR